ncbi:MAG: carbohydrate kinase [Tenericutes bacterium]|nr:carbohydrate kinase [Mycoplasmatota bacterium]
MIWDETLTTSKKSLDVLLIGEVLIDVIHNQVTNKTVEIVGGSPYNLSKNLTKLGINNIFYGSIGNDRYGEMITDDVLFYGINANILKTNKKTSYVLLNQTSDSPNPLFYRDADKLINYDENLVNDAMKAKILHFTYWPLSDEPSLSTICSLAKKAKDHNALISFDPNYHKDIDTLGNGLEIIKDLIHIVDIIKPSLDDSERLFGKLSINEYLDIYQGLGAKLTILTLGQDGLIAKYKKETIKMDSLAEEIVDSTGAGDAFWGGLYSGILSGLSIKDSLTLGLLCSAENLKTVGSNMNIPKLNELIERLRK